MGATRKGGPPQKIMFLDPGRRVSSMTVTHHLLKPAVFRGEGELEEYRVHWGEVEGDENFMASPRVNSRTLLHG